MSGLGVFLAKEAREVTRTWRMWVLPSIMLALGVMSPVFAELTPALLDSISAQQPGLVIDLPEPAAIDSYLQWTKNLAQIALIAVVISLAGMVSSEKKSGTAVLVLTKPLSREGFVVAKALSNWVLLLGSTVLGAAVCWVGTRLIFDGALQGEFVGATLVWFALASVITAVMTLLSVAIGSQGGAAGAGLGVYAVLAALSAWGPARDYSTAGLFTIGNDLLAGEQVAVGWPVATAAVVAVVCVVAAAILFRRQEI